MPTARKFGLFMLVSLLTTALTATFLFMAPLSARYLHLQFGRWSYWAFTAASSVALYFVFPQWALAQFTLLLLIGLYTELEQFKLSVFYSALSSVFIAGTTMILLLAVWARVHALNLSRLLQNNIGEALAASKRLQQVQFTMDAAQAVSLFPAMVAMLLMLLVFFSVLFIRPKTENEQLTWFRIPDFAIWIFIGSLAGTFMVSPEKHYVLQRICFNALFICSAGYYFQGLAVLGFYFKRMRLNYLLRAALFFILAFHLLPVVAALGLSDVWFAYRSRADKNLVENNPNMGDAS